MTTSTSPVRADGAAVSIEPFVVRRPLLIPPIAFAMLLLVAAAFAMHWGDVSAGVLQPAVVDAAIIVAVGVAIAIWNALQSTRLLVRDDRIESADGFTGRVFAVHQADDIELCYVYRKTAGRRRIARAAPWTVRVAYRDGQYDDVDAAAQNTKRLVAYLADRRVPRVDAPPVDDEQSTTDWARTTERTGRGTRIVTRVCALTTAIIAAAATIYLVQQLQATSRSSSWPTVPGRVIYSTVRADGRLSQSTVYTPEVRYLYRVGGRTFEGTHIAFGVYRTTDADLARDVNAQYAVGTTAAVYYNPDKPSMAVLQLKPDRMRWSALMLAACILCLGLYGLFVRIPPYRQPPV
jgi:hypothetical protein